MIEVPTHYVHFLIRRKLGGGSGWYAPYELEDDDSSGAGLVIALDQAGKPFNEYGLDVMLEDEKGKTPFYYILRPREKGKFVLETPSVHFDFRERGVDVVERALPYLGKLNHPDFIYPLMELEPVSDDIYDLVLGNQSITLIGCNPFEQYMNADGTHLSDHRLLTV